MEAETSIAPERLVAWAAGLLEAHGTPPKGAERVARALVEADRSGHSSHGVGLLPYYVELIGSGALDPTAEAVISERHGALIRMDGRRGFGQLAGEDATELALETATEHGVAAVAGRDAGHLGRLGAYTERIGATGLAGILLANNQGADQQIAPLGSAERRLTNNPISIGVPGATLDMALSVAAEGRVYRARDRGERLPAGWILDSEGAHSTDPQAYIDGGSLLPMGGEAAAHKGQGLIVLVDLLVGLLASGGMCGPEERPFSNSFVLVCLDPGADARSAYLAELPAFVDWVKSAAPLAGAPAPLIPGEPEQRAREAGPDVLLDDATLRALNEVGGAAGLPVLG